MDLFDKFAPYKGLRDDLSSLDANPLDVRLERVTSPTEAIINGHHTILVGTHNYLGLTFDEECVEASIEAVREQGTGTTGSRVANGTYAAHAALENDLADFFGRKAAIVFSTGYQANVGMLSALLGPKDHVLIDADSHASIYDGCMMANGTVIRFRHNDTADLEKKLARLERDDRNKLIVVEGIYSMLGDTAPLEEIVRLSKEYNAYLLVDEAHSVGVLGANGRGLAEKLGVENEIDFITGTFSKSLAAVGGFCVSDHPDFELLRIASRPYMFTASLPPSVMASATRALEALRTRPELRSKLWENVAHFYNGLEELGFTLGDEVSPVVAVLLPSRDIAVQFWRELLDAGVYVNLAIPPGTPHNVFLLRCSLCAAHTDEQLQQVLATFEKVGNRLGVLSADREAATA